MRTKLWSRFRWIRRPSCWFLMFFCWGKWTERILWFWPRMIWMFGVIFNPPDEDKVNRLVHEQPRWRHTCRPQTEWKSQLAASCRNKQKQTRSCFDLYNKITVYAAEAETDAEMKGFLFSPGRYFNVTSPGADHQVDPEFFNTELNIDSVKSFVSSRFSVGKLLS